MKKIFFIAALGQEAKEKIKNGTFYFEEQINNSVNNYFLAHPECSFELELVYKMGTRWADFLYDCYYYFDDKDIEKLCEEIESLIKSDEIVGLIIDPILTFEEEELYRKRGFIWGRTLEKIYNQFSQVLPICYYICSDCGSFYTEEICKKINNEYKNSGYTKENGYFEIPRVTLGNYHGELESMIKYFIDFYNKRQEESFKLEKVKKESK